MSLAVEKIGYADGDLALTGHLVRPAADPRAAILVLPTIANCDDVMLQRAQALAEQGYLAFVADYYGRTFADRTEMFAAGRGLMQDHPAFRTRLAAALETLDALSGLPRSRMTVIGHCMGGAGALELTRVGHGLAAAVSFHGALVTAMPAAAGAVTARVLVCHGHQDSLIPPEHVRAFESEMDAAGADWHLHVYSRVRHGFTNPLADGVDNPNLKFDESANRHSWNAMLTLFDEVFG